MDLNSADDWFKGLQNLLPIGAAWPRGRDTVLSKLLLALAPEFARLEARSAQVLDESDPSTMVEMLEDWERWLDLPSHCMALETQSFGQRRMAVVDKLTDVGGQRPQDYIALAAHLGAVITIDVFSVTTDMSSDMLPEYTHDWRFFWQVNMPPLIDSIRYSTDLSPDMDPLADWGNRLVECVIRARSPAHTIVLFAYPY